MNAPSEPEAIEQQSATPSTQPRRRKRLLRTLTIAIFTLAACASFTLRDHIRTLQSLRRIPGTNAYVMDYYVDYNIDQIRRQGMDVHNVENSLIDVFFPGLLVPIATGMKGRYIDEEVVAISSNEERCSTVALRTAAGKVFFGRNLDWKHDACLILQIHDSEGVASVAVLDIHYLNLNRDDLETTSLIERLPLLFAPYYLQDGMNRFGVAVADMSVDEVKTPYDPAKPDLIHATAMRLILDYAKTTDEAIELLKQYNIHFAETTCHLLIADASGKSAVVEFFDGELQTTHTDQNWQVCTNHRICGNSERASDETCDRYRLASEQLAKSGADAGADDVMQIMASVSKDYGDIWTMWTSVYDLTSREIRVAYKRQFDNPYAGSLEAAE